MVLKPGTIMMPRGKGQQEEELVRLLPVRLLPVRLLPVRLLLVRLLLVRLLRPGRVEESPLSREVLLPPRRRRPVGQGFLYLRSPCRTPRRIRLSSS